MNAEEEQKRLAEMQAAGIVEIDDQGDGAPSLALTDWGRRSAAVLMAAIRWERRFAVDPAPVSAEDALALLLMPLPLVRLGADQRGTCLLTVDLDPAPGRARSAELWLRLRDGQVVEHSTEPRRRRAPSALIHGSLDAWFAALLDGEPARLRLSGRTELAEVLLAAIHTELRGPP